jgi:hypothetical protein
MELRGFKGTIRQSPVNFVIEPMGEGGLKPRDRFYLMHQELESSGVQVEDMFEYLDCVSVQQVAFGGSRSDPTLPLNSVNAHGVNSPVRGRRRGEKERLDIQIWRLEQIKKGLE